MYQPPVKWNKYKIKKCFEDNDTFNFVLKNSTKFNGL